MPERDAGNGAAPHDRSTQVGNVRWLDRVFTHGRVILSSCLIGTRTFLWMTRKESSVETQVGSSRLAARPKFESCPSKQSRLVQDA